MEKIPVWRSIGSAYGFAFGNLAAIIGMIWLPMTILLVGGYFAIAHYFGGLMEAVASSNRYAAYSGAGYFYLYRGISLLFEAIMVVAVMRNALGQRVRAPFVHLALGLTELRMFAALVANALIILLLEIIGAIVVLIAAALIGYVARTVGVVDGVSASVIGLWAVLALLATFFFTVLFVTVRLSFLLPAVTVAEDRIDLIRAWELTHDNFWRGFWITLFVNTPTWLLYVGLQFAFVGFAATVAATSVSPMAVQLAGSMQSVAARMHFILAWLPYLYAAWFLVRPLGLGLASGASAAAYRALVPDAPAVSTPPADRLVPAAIG